jgi:hypothetical protein
MGYTFFDDTDYQCYPELGNAVFLMSLLNQYISGIVSAYTVIDDEAVLCVLTDTGKAELISNILIVWGAIALDVPFNRAIYPLPMFSGVFVDV